MKIQNASLKTFDRNKLHNVQQGFTLIELLVAIGLTALFLPALVFVFSFSLGSASQGENYTLAYTLAQEQMEAIYYLKENDLDWDWTEFSPFNTAADEYYQPQIEAGRWTLGSRTDNPQLTDGKYTATVKILPVKRDAVGNISEEEGSDQDDTSRKIIIKVSWKENGIPTDIDLVSYVSRH